MPYLYGSAVETAQSGIPMMRSMVLEFSEDHNCDYLARQYMLGEKLLIAPIFNEQGVAEYYLPEGRWTSFLTGEVKEGGRWYREVHDYFSMPILVRENSILALGNKCDSAVYDYADHVNFCVYELSEGKDTAAKVYSPENVLEAEIHVVKEGGSIQMKVEAPKNCRIILKHMAKPAAISGGSFQMENGDVVIIPTDHMVTLVSSD